MKAKTATFFTKLPIQPVVEMSHLDYITSCLSITRTQGVRAVATCFDVDTAGTIATTILGRAVPSSLAAIANGLPTDRLAAIVSILHGTLAARAIAADEIEKAQIAESSSVTLNNGNGR
jgi:hypothetical protein